ncbi:hypothetical protein K438DRAFT_1973418 [Mycena galopus ATCC 62051]|nr:hypothetical protein K438DRAFT_1973418 [Mycena galopus ATCC 62051]
MFQPFDNPSQFYPGLIVWCDTNSREIDVSTLAPTDLYDRRKAREPRPCLVVAPLDTHKWVRVDTAPAITWRNTNSDAWIWVGTPPTLAMVFNEARIMHPHKEKQFISNPIAASNVQNYWVHRENYLRRSQTQSAQPSGQRVSSRHYSHRSAGNMSSTVQNMRSSTRSISGPVSYPNFASPSSGIYSQPPGFSTLCSQPVVVPMGFTETNPNSPGWWRNPETGWFWHASRGLLPPPTGKQ